MWIAYLCANINMTLRKHLPEAEMDSAFLQVRFPGWQMDLAWKFSVKTLQYLRNN